ncbi:hypothetical protein F444_18590 [Phytophthora nicotianae P1976]|uniref:Ndc10 domain-containing protein n=1 Tax=Phytophthora nicotianae P1976 TaxID=1317066 RepID=A0A080ZAW4_PHYNI|nr:hypothetical protein F444_18590 [Phytophthora nicotianae P1976]
MDTVESVYSALLAREATRAMSGHPPRSRKYYLERAILDPQDCMQTRISPGLDTYKKILDGTWERKLAARGFTELMEYLCVVLIQDSAFMFEHLPPRIKNHAAFGDRFQQYRKQVLARAQTSQHSMEMQLPVAMPLLSQQNRTHQ